MQTKNKNFRMSCYPARSAKILSQEMCASTRSTLSTHFSERSLAWWTTTWGLLLKAPTLKVLYKPWFSCGSILLVLWVSVRSRGEPSALQKANEIYPTKRNKQLNHVHLFSNPSLAKVMSKTTPMSWHVMEYIDLAKAKGEAPVNEFIIYFTQ